MMDNKKMEVNFTGKEYIEYLKYKDSKKFKLPKGSEWFIGAAIISIILIGILIELSTPPVVPKPLTWNNVLMFLGFAAGIGWIFHGTGFLLVRR